MYIYFLPPPTYDGRILLVLKDEEVFGYDLSTLNPEYREFQIDEIVSNNNICIDITRTQGKTDINGDGKYYMVNNAGIWELHPTDNWQEYVPEGIL